LSLWLESSPFLCLRSRPCRSCFLLAFAFSLCHDVWYNIKRVYIVGREAEVMVVVLLLLVHREDLLWCCCAVPRGQTNHRPSPARH
jgi:hypothetical protein